MKETKGFNESHKALGRNWACKCTRSCYGLSYVHVAYNARKTKSERLTQAPKVDGKFFHSM